MIKRQHPYFCYAILFILTLVTVSNTVSAQLAAGLRFGGNLSHLEGNSFRSAKKIGLQLGVALQYNFTPNIAQQAEPAFNSSRVRANEQTAMLDNGIAKGTKALYYFNLPVFFKLHITRKFALLAGPEWNSLSNPSKYRLNNGEEAFNAKPRFGYSLGIELGKIYFRYREVKRVANVHADWHAAIEQYQLGLKWDIFE